MNEHDRPRIRVFIVDDHAVVRRGLHAFLASEPDIEVIGEASDGRDAVRDVSRMIADGNQPDVVLMDLLMPGLDGGSATVELRRVSDTLRVVIMTSSGEVEHLRAALQAGVAGYVLKESRVENVVTAVRAASAGQLYLDPAVSPKLPEAVTHVSPDYGLTTREREVVSLVARGRSTRDIAGDLFISERTARTHVSHLLGKLGLESRIQLALWGREHRFDRD